MTRLGVLTLALIPLAASASAATYYVAMDGNDSQSGSRQAPFRKLSRAVEVAGAGDTVVVRDGTYGHESAVTGGDGNDSNRSPVWLRKSGTSKDWITITAENKGGAVLDCEMLCDSYINLYNAAYVVIQNFVITRAFKEGIHSNDAAHHITLRGNRIEYIANRNSSTPLGLSGMYTNPNCHDFLIDGNVFHNIGRTNASQLDHGLYLHGSNITVTNNVFYDIPHGWAIQTAEGLDNLLVAHNVFAATRGGPPGLIMLWNRQTRLVIQNNTFYGGEQYAIARHHASIASCTIDHNLIYGSPAVMPDSSGCAVEANQMSPDRPFVYGSTRSDGAH
jgi:Right handed beta helix region/Protein of unknown function (DUF1565)